MQTEFHVDSSNNVNEFFRGRGGNSDTIASWTHRERFESLTRTCRQCKKFKSESGFCKSHPHSREIFSKAVAWNQTIRKQESLLGDFYNQWSSTCQYENFGGRSAYWLSFTTLTWLSLFWTDCTFFEVFFRSNRSFWKRFFKPRRSWLRKSNLHRI